MKLAEVLEVHSCCLLNGEDCKSCQNLLFKIDQLTSIYTHLRCIVFEQILGQAWSFAHRIVHGFRSGISNFDQRGAALSLSTQSCCYRKERFGFPSSSRRWVTFYVIYHHETIKYGDQWIICWDINKWFVLDHIGLGIEEYVSSDLTLAIANAILRNTSSLETNPSCLTGNCTFPIFSFLGFCFNCIDITQHLQQTSNCTQRKLAKNEHGNPEYDKPHESNELICTYWLPLFSSGRNYTYVNSLGESWNGSDITLSWEKIYWKDTKRITYKARSSLLITYLVDSGLIGTDTFRLFDEEVIPSSFATIAFIKGSPATGAVSTDYIDTANICAFSFCAREYDVSMKSGLLRSEIVSTAYSGLKGSVFDLNSPEKFASSYTFTFPDHPSNDFTFVHKSQPIQDIHGGTRTLWEPIELKLFGVFQRVFENGFFLITDFDMWELRSEWIQNELNASTNIPKTMDRVAAAMTNHFRDISNHTVIGQSGSMEVFIRVFWLWILFPILSICFGTILLIWIIIVTRRRKLSVWKASELALFFHGLDFPLNDSVDTRQVSAMEEVTSAVQVRLTQDVIGTLKLRRKLD